MMYKKTLKQLSLISILTLCANYSYAEGSAGAMSISATTAISCTVTASPLEFGQYNGSDLSVPVTVQVNCSSPNFNYWLAADLGMNQTMGQRRLYCSDSMTYLLYDLYKRDNTPWGDVGMSRAHAMDGMPSGNTMNFTMTGRISAGQNIMKNNEQCTDTVTVTFLAP